MSPFVLLLALSVHSIFEGIALGISKHEKDVLNLALAIVIHKGAASTSLGISLIKAFPDDKRLITWLMFTFGCATPVGVIIGMLLVDSGELTEIIFNSLAAGTFIYIACSEVII